MKLITKKQFLETTGPLAYIRYNVSTNIEVKIGVPTVENNTQWYYQDLFGFANPTEEDGTDGISLTAQKAKLENGESIPNQPWIKLTEENENEDDMFLIFEIEDMQNMIIPLAECFDKLTKDFFKPQE